MHEPTTQDAIETHQRAAYILIADIVGYSTVQQAIQAQWVQEFFAILRQALESSGSQAHNIFPTGDGAILALYADGGPTMSSALVPLDLARQLLQLNRDGQFRLRISINYSQSETVFHVTGAPFIGTVPMETGEGIYLAERALHFAEPNEIILTEQYWDVLRVHGLLAQLLFEPLRRVFVKHFRPIDLHIYVPSEDEVNYVARPTHAIQPLRRYAYFPPLRPETVARFATLGLSDELERLCRYTYESVAVVNSRFAFVSWSNVYDILKRLNSINREDDEVLILSRSDRSPNFWSTRAAVKYLGHLQAGRTRRFNQVRIFVYADADKPLASTQVLSALRDLHGHGSLLRIDRAYLAGNILLKYPFGVTIYPKLGCAVAPIPPSTSYDDYLEAVSFTPAHGTFLRFTDTPASPEEFRAHVTVAAKTVGELADGFAALRKHLALEAM